MPGARGCSPMTLLQSLTSSRFLRVRLFSQRRFLFFWRSVWSGVKLWSLIFISRSNSFRICQLSLLIRMKSYFYISAQISLACSCASLLTFSMFSLRVWLFRSIVFSSISSEERRVQMDQSVLCSQPRRVAYSSPILLSVWVILRVISDSCLVWWSLVWCSFSNSSPMPFNLAATELQADYPPPARVARMSAIRAISPLSVRGAMGSLMAQFWEVIWRDR